MKVLFLYTEIAGYFLSCLHALVKKGVEVHLVHWPVNPEAPFDFSFPDSIKTYPRKSFTKDQLLELARAISPDVIYCSGWLDKEYLNVCEQFNGKIPAVVGFDNTWKGTLKQYIGSLFSKSLLHKYFTCCWIPGAPQVSYAQHMNFKKDKILTGIYSCDHQFFHGLFLENAERKNKKFPHRLLFTGRYYDFKGITDLWQAFAELYLEEGNNWELWCIGTGDIKPVSHPGIRHFGFIQPSEIGKFVAECGVFVLPSRFEPWGVAVHEFASAGMPLVCSSEVGAATMFLKEGENGFSFKANNIPDLKKVLKKIMSLSDEKLFKMGEKSAEMSAQITPEKWSDTLISLMKNK